MTDVSRRQLITGTAALSLMASLPPFKARAQEELFFELPPIVVSDTSLGTYDNLWSTTIPSNFNSLDLDSKWYALFGPNHPPPAHHPLARQREAQIVADEIARRQAIQDAAVNQVIYGDPPTFTNPYSQYVADHLATVGLYTAEALAVAFFIEGASGVIAEALPALRATASQLIAEGFNAGTLSASISLIGSGVFVGFTALAVTAAALALIGITLYYVWPDIARQIRATSNSPANYSGMLSIAQS